MAQPRPHARPGTTGAARQPHKAGARRGRGKVTSKRRPPGKVTKAPPRIKKKKQGKPKLDDKRTRRRTPDGPKKPPGPNKPPHL